MMLAGERLDYRFHVVREGNEWRLMQQGNGRPLRVSSTRREVEMLGDLVARQYQGELVIHRTDGGVETQRRYGVEPSLL